MSLGNTITELEVTRDRCLRVAGLADQAVAALRALAAETTEPAPRALPPARPARRLAPVAAAPATTRPTTGTCEACRKPIQIAPTGRIRRFCGPACKGQARTAIRQAIEDHQREEEDATDAALRRPEPIPETGPGMKARIQRAMAAPARRTFLDQARERNDEAARRSAAAAR